MTPAMHYLESLIASIEMGSEITVQLSELKMLKMLLEIEKGKK